MGVDRLPLWAPLIPASVSVSPTSPFSPYPAATLLLQLPQGRDVALGQIHDMNVIPDACRRGRGCGEGPVRVSVPPQPPSWLTCAILRVVVVAKDIQFLPPPNRHLGWRSA